MNNKAHWGFWVIALLGLLWNAGGIMNYMMQMKPEFVASMPDAHRAIIEGRPSWATGGFAIGVFGGALGCLLLLLRKKIAGPVFMVSLMGIFVTMIHALGIAVSGNDVSISVIFQIIVLPILVANFLIGLTFYALKKEWLA
ncbi:MAG: hypothetical protein V7749_15190 [Cocleimonas sp.]